MNYTKQYTSFLMILFVSTLISGCDLLRGLTAPTTTPILATPTKPSMSIDRIKQTPTDFKDRLISLRGYGVTMLTVPLCPGYVGMDTRHQFIDVEVKSIVARWQPSAQGVERTSTPRTFEGYVRIFEGEIGCPGSIHGEMFPYFEIVRVE